MMVWTEVELLFVIPLFFHSRDLGKEIPVITRSSIWGHDNVSMACCPCICACKNAEVPEDLFPAARAERRLNGEAHQDAGHAVSKK